MPNVVARVTRIEGTVSIMRNGSAEWRAAKPSTPLEVGDQVYTRKKVLRKSGIRSVPFCAWTKRPR